MNSLDFSEEMNFRNPDRKETTLLNRAFDRWGVFDKLKRFAVLVADSKTASRRAVSVASPELATMAGAVQPFLAGLLIGELSRKQFSPSMAGADLFCRLSGAQGKYYVTINHEAEKLAMYGRDILGVSVIHASEELEENEMVILVNSRLEAVALGMTRYSGDMLTGSRIATITTTADAGQYLRNEGG